MKTKKIFAVAILITIAIIIYITYPNWNNESQVMAEAAPIPVEKKEEPPKVEEPKINAPPIVQKEQYKGKDEILALREKYGNNEIIGVLKIDDTNIDYPVTQYSDNEFYLHHALNKEPSSQGTVFMDYENNPAATDLNTIIYAHNQNNEQMFHNIRYYEDKEFYETHKYITLKTLDKETKWEIFAFYRPTLDFPYIQVVFPSKESFDDMVSGIVERAKYDTGVTVDKDDIILSLSTCTPDDSPNERIVISAKLIKDDDQSR